MKIDNIENKTNNLMTDLVKIGIDDLIGDFISKLTPKEILDYRKESLDDFLKGIDSDEIAGYMYNEVMDLNDAGVENLLMTVDQNSAIPHDEFIEMCYRDFDNIIYRIDTERTLDMLSTLEGSYHAT